MYRIPMEEILNKTNSIYKLVILASRRAAELNSGAGNLINAGPNIKPSVLALEEIRQGKVRIKKETKGEGKKSKK